MGYDMNQVQLIGRLTKDPVLSPVTGDFTVSNITLAMNQKSKEKEKCIFIDVSVFGKTAENLCKHLKKGDQLGIVGYLDQHTWTNQEGKQISKIKVVSEKIFFLSKKKSAISESDDNVPTFSEIMGTSTNSTIDW